MSERPLNELVRQLAQTVVADLEQLEAVLGAKFQPTDRNEHWTFYEIELREGPFVKADYRVSRAGDRALLSLTPRDPVLLTEASLDLAPWGEVKNINVNPRIPPEGTDTLVFETNGVQLAFQFTHHTRNLRTLTLRWEAGS